MGVKLAVHQKHIIPFVLRRLDESVLLVSVGCIEVNDLLVLVGLVVSHGLAVVLKGEILAVGVLQEGKLQRPLAELLVGEHAIFNEQLEVVPLLLPRLALVLEYLLQSVGHLLGDVGRDLLDILVGLKITSGHVERDVRRIDDTVKEGQEIRDDVLDVVGDEHLVAVELDVVLLDRHPVLDLREVEDAGEVERIVNIQVDVEQRILLHRVEIPVELHVVLLLQLGRLAGPQRLDLVDDVVLVGVDIFAVLPFLFLAEDDWNRHELAVLVQKLLDLTLRAVVLGGLVVKVKCDDGASLSLVARPHLELRIAFAGPDDPARSLFPGKRLDSHFLRDHESRVESQAEMADDVLILVLLEELTGGRERDLIDVPVDFLISHTDTGINDPQRLGLLVKLDAHLKLAKLALEVSVRCDGLHLLRSVHCVRDQLPQENLVIRIEKLLDDREYVLGRHSNLSFVAFCCHNIFPFKILRI